MVFNSVTSNLVAAGSRDEFIRVADALGMRLEEPTHIELDNNNPIDILKAVK
jgi:hypothetical protein